MIRGYFSGAYVNGIDAKHRLSVPAPFRDTVEARSETRAIVFAAHQHAPCLVAFDLTHFERLQAELAARFANDFGPGRSAAARDMFSLSDTLKYDDNGRVILTPMLRDLGELEAQAIFLGTGDTFEVWSPANLLAVEGQDPRMLRTVKALMAQKAGG